MADNTGDDYRAEEAARTCDALAVRLAHDLDECESALKRLEAARAPRPPAALLGLLALLACACGAAADACAEPAAVDDLIHGAFGAPVNYLYELCLADGACTDLFGLVDEVGGELPGAREGFGVLLNNALDADDDVARPFSHAVWPLLCAAPDDTLSPAQALRLADLYWVGRITVGLALRPKCYVNERFVVNPQTGDGTCVCVGDRDCAANDDLTTEWRLAFLLIVVLGALFVLTRCVNFSGDLLGA